MPRSKETYWWRSSRANGLWTSILPRTQHSRRDGQRFQRIQTSPDKRATTEAEYSIPMGAITGRRWRITADQESIYTKISKMRALKDMGWSEYGFEQHSDGIKILVGRYVRTFSRPNDEQQEGIFRTIIPSVLREIALRLFHKGFVHPGQRRIWLSLKNHYYWEQME